MGNRNGWMHVDIPPTKAACSTAGNVAHSLRQKCLNILHQQMTPPRVKFRVAKSSVEYQITHRWRIGDWWRVTRRHLTVGREREINRAPNVVFRIVTVIITGLPYSVLLPFHHEAKRGNIELHHRTDGAARHVMESIREITAGLFISFGNVERKPLYICGSLFLLWRQQSSQPSKGFYVCRLYSYKESARYGKMWLMWWTYIRHRQKDKPRKAQRKSIIMFPPGSVDLWLCSHSSPDNTSSNPWHDNCSWMYGQPWEPQYYHNVLKPETTHTHTKTYHKQ